MLHTLHWWTTDRLRLVVDLRNWAHSQSLSHHTGLSLAHWQADTGEAKGVHLRLEEVVD